MFGVSHGWNVRPEVFLLLFYLFVLFSNHIRFYKSLYTKSSLLLNLLPSPWETETAGSQVQGLPGLQSEFMAVAGMLG